MKYICLYCNRTSTANAAPNCTTCRRGMTASKRWNGYATGTLTTLRNYNPSSRRCMFDVHVSQANQAIYIVVNVAITYDDTGRGGAWWFWQKTAYLDLLRAAVGLWDDRVTFQHTAAANNNITVYRPYFFIDDEAESVFTNVTMTVSRFAEPTRFQGQLMLPGNAAVTLAGPYDNQRPAPTNGKKYPLTIQLLSIAPRTYIDDTTATANNQLHVNTMAHEYGHLIGLPDEYDAYPQAFDTAHLQGGRVQRGTNNGDKDRAVAYWVELLGQYQEQSPAWGHQGDKSIMRNIDARATSFRRRHYVTVLEALNFLITKSSDLPGTWAMV